MLGEEGISLGIPNLGINAVEDAYEPISSVPKYPIETVAVICCLDLRGVPWAHGRYNIAVYNACLQEVALSPVLHPLHCERLGGEMGETEECAGEYALEGEVVDGENARGCGETWVRTPMVNKVGGGEGRLPIVKVENVRKPVGADAECVHRATEQNEAFGVVLVVATLRIRMAVEVGAVEEFVFLEEVYLDTVVCCCSPEVDGEVMDPYGDEDLLGNRLNSSSLLKPLRLDLSVKGHEDFHLTAKLL